MKIRLLPLTLTILLSAFGVCRAQLPEKVLFLGNSITKHGKAPKIGWEGNWGMAASAEDKDYVHLVVSALTKLEGKAPPFTLANIADFERSYETYDIATKLKDELAFKADVVIVAIGENVKQPTTDEAKAKLKEKLLELFKAIKSSGPNTLYVRSSFWANPVKDAILKEACDAVGGVWVDISALSKEESNYARSERKFENDGVARHPGDRGMQAIADALVGAIQKSGK